jgi:hypothetical protein
LRLAFAEGANDGETARERQHEIGIAGHGAAIIARNGR